MAKKLTTVDFSKLTDDKALAIAAFGESVAAYRYIVLSEKTPDPKLRASFEDMARDERTQREPRDKCQPADQSDFDEHLETSECFAVGERFAQLGVEFAKIHARRLTADSRPRDRSPT